LHGAVTEPFGATVLEHFRRPRNRRALEQPSASHEAYNALCGDRIRVEVMVAGGVIRDAGFSANACALCTAAASVLTEHVSGMSLTDATTLADDVVIAALGSELPPARVACATLPIRALHGALARLQSGA